MDVGLLLGRDRELSVLVDALDGASRSQGGLVVLVGEPGIGKTALLGEIARIATGRGWVTARASAPRPHRGAAVLAVDPDPAPASTARRPGGRPRVAPARPQPDHDTDPGGPDHSPEHVARSRFEIADRWCRRSPTRRRPAAAHRAGRRPRRRPVVAAHARVPRRRARRPAAGGGGGESGARARHARRDPPRGDAAPPVRPGARDPRLTAPDVATFLQAIHAAGRARPGRRRVAPHGREPPVRARGRPHAVRGRGRPVGALPGAADGRAAVPAVEPRPAGPTAAGRPRRRRRGGRRRPARGHGGRRHRARARAGHRRRHRGRHRRRAGTGGAVLPSAAARGGVHRPLRRGSWSRGTSGRVDVGGEYRAAAGRARRPPLRRGPPRHLPQAVDAARSPRASGRTTPRLRRGGRAPRARASRRPAVPDRLAPRRRRARAGHGGRPTARRRLRLGARRLPAWLPVSRRGGARGSPRPGGTRLRGGGLRVRPDAHRPGRPLDRAAPAGDRRPRRAGRSRRARPIARASGVARPGEGLAGARPLLRQRRRACQPVGPGRRRRRPALERPRSGGVQPRVPADRELGPRHQRRTGRAVRRDRAPRRGGGRLRPGAAGSPLRALRGAGAGRRGHHRPAGRKSSTASPTRPAPPRSGLRRAVPRHASAPPRRPRGRWWHVAAADAIGGRIRSVNIAQFCTAQRFTIARLDGEWGDLPERFAEFVGPTGSGPTWRCMSAQLAAEMGDDDGARAGLEAMADAGYRSVSTDVHFLFSLCCLAEAAVILGERARAGRAARPPRPPRRRSSCPTSRRSTGR